MSKRENSKPYAREVQNGPIRMEDQYTQKFHREPEHTMRDLENNRILKDKMTLTLHTPKK